ncbi:unnamed protein product [Lactuca virosa]|uniref:Uncharacterized protein n=1 Tax=Lactuca virosa TaxID=75947 RepID=A0AAU9PKV7_9ASTR|nr:unnamed protein product [Lactuca virosa]
MLFPFLANPSYNTYGFLTTIATHLIQGFSSICNATPTLFSPFSQPIPLLPFHCRFRFIAADLQSEAVAARCSVSFAHPKLFSRCLAAGSTTHYSSSLFISLPWIFSRRRGNRVATRVTLYLRRSSISVIVPYFCVYIIVLIRFEAWFLYLHLQSKKIS